MLVVFCVSCGTLNRNRSRGGKCVMEFSFGIFTNLMKLAIMSKLASQNEKFQ